MGVLVIRALPHWVHIWAPDFWGRTWDPSRGSSQKVCCRLYTRGFVHATIRMSRWYTVYTVLRTGTSSEREKVAWSLGKSRRMRRPKSSKHNLEVWHLNLGLQELCLPKRRLRSGGVSGIDARMWTPGGYHNAQQRFNFGQVRIQQRLKPSTFGQ